jgi:hypothetical protein
MRRVLILGLALSLIAAGSVPLSACALFSSQLGECKQAMTESPCDQMDSHNGETQISGSSDNSCCVISQAPAPELQYKAAEVSLAATTVAVAVNMLAVPPIRPSSTLLAVVEKPSAPSFQSLLCTFLI